MYFSSKRLLSSGGISIRNIAISISMLVLFYVVSAMGVTPVPGEWSASTKFGDLVFVIDNSSSKVTNLNLSYSDFKCGVYPQVTRSGSMSISNFIGWPIDNNQFVIEHETTFNPGAPGTPSEKGLIVIRGTFDQSGTQASGTWEETVFGELCSCRWQAKHEGA
jgi:hypothetical protein